MAASERLGHPVALWAFRELEGRPDVDKQLVYVALCRRLGVQSDEGLAAMGEALRACAGELGVVVPSAAQYEAWRMASPSGVGAPTIAQLRRACGSWSKALVLLSDAPEADPTRRRLLLAHGRRFSEEAALRAVRKYLAWLPKDELPTLSRYLEWASCVPRDEDGRTRVPSKDEPFIRLFGSWIGALRAAGVEPSRMHVRRARRARRFTRDDVLAALRAAFAELGEPLSRLRYDAWVRERDRQAGDEGSRFPPAPLSATISNELGGWRNACTTVLGANVLLSRRVRPLDFTDEQLMRMYRECRQDIGRPPSGDEYDVWRLARTQTTPVDKTNALPHSNTLRRRLGVGAWSGVALAAGEQLPRSRRRRAEFSTDELAAAYRACATAVGHDPSNSEFDEWREARLRENPTDRVPAAWTLVRRLGAGSWTSIAGTVNPGATTPRCRRPVHYSDDELAAAWRACRDDLRRSPRQDAYDGWRHRRMRSNPHGQPLPFSRTLLKRLGGGTWRGVEHALQAGEVAEHDAI
jgi:hypothetical protein